MNRLALHSLLTRRCLSSGAAVPILRGRATAATTVENPMVQTTASGDLPVTTQLKITNTAEADKWPVFR